MKMLTPKNYLKVLNRKYFSTGFTLVETMLAASLTSMVVGAAGFGLVNLLSSNQTANASSEIEYDLNRAVEFISDEIKGANQISTNTSGTGFDDESGARKVILVLEMPQVDESKNPIRVIYYTRAKADEKNKTPWQGPQILYRWGPNFDADGQYEMKDNDGDKINEIPAPKNGTTVVWQYEPLIDLIADNIDADKKQCNNPGWSRSPVKDADVKGFFVCLNSDRKLVELHAHSSAKLNNEKKVAYEVATEVFARAEPTISTIIPDLPFKITPTFETLEPAQIKFEVLGGAVSCVNVIKKGKKVVTTSTPITLSTTLDLTYPDGKTETKYLLSKQPLQLPVLPAGTKVKIKSSAYSNSCAGKVYDNTIDSDDQTSVRIKVLKNGDDVPDYTTFDNQATIKSFLQPYIQDEKIKLADNQVIFLFEHGSGFTDLPDFDLQDNVVLATVEPPN